jgi:hypothetical protein
VRAHTHAAVSQLKTLVYHGLGKNKYTAEQLAAYDVVLTNYHTVARRESRGCCYCFCCFVVFVVLLLVVVIVVSVVVVGLVIVVLLFGLVGWWY